MKDYNGGPAETLFEIPFVATQGIHLALQRPGFSF
jgi:hypothetical protein